MTKIIELRQTVARGYPTTWNIPHIRDGDRWRIIENVHLVENPHHINGHDHCEDAIFRAKRIMEQRGWSPDQKIEKIDDDKIRLKFSASSAVELISWILSFGEDARVIDSDWLVEEVVNKANRTAVLYQK